MLRLGEALQVGLRWLLWQAATSASGAALERVDLGSPRPCLSALRLLPRAAHLRPQQRAGGLLLLPTATPREIE
eukprot:2214666-Lingulodinium_polyedra.AAC.1